MTSHYFNFQTNDFLIWSWIIFHCTYTPCFFSFFLQTFFIVYAITVVPSFSPFFHLYPSSPSPLLSQSSYHCLWPWILHKCSLVNPFTIFYSVSPMPCGSCQSIPHIYVSVSILYISLLHLLDSTYKWDHVAFVFYWMVYFI